MSEILQNGDAAAARPTRILTYVGVAVFLVGALLPVWMGAHAWMEVVRWFGLALLRRVGGADRR